MRRKIDFDAGWLFHEGDIDTGYPAYKGPVYSQAKTERVFNGPASRYYNARNDDFDTSAGRELCIEKWEKVNLPHDYIIKKVPREENNNAVGFFDHNNSWYRKSFTVDEADRGRRHILYFEGVASRATVWLNGCLMKYCGDGFTSFEVDISDVVDYGAENVVAVYVETGTCDGWWYEGGGIYRHVSYIITEDIAVDMYGVYVCPRKVGGALWHTDIETTLVCDRVKSAAVSVETLIYSSDEKIVASASTNNILEPYSKTVLKYAVDIDSPELWDTDSPVMYKAITNVYEDSVLIDTYETRFGFREFKIDPDRGLFLNGKHVKIKGMCAHQDFGITGKAVPDNIQRHKIALIKEMGANGFRASHYPHSEATMDALDEMGFIVMNEVRRFESTPEALSQLEMLVKRDRNRPSVLFWSIGNEERFHGTDEGVRIARRMSAFVKKLDDMRYVTTAYSLGEGHNAVGGELDALGINYNLDYLDKAHADYPDIGIFSSENCATGTVRGHYLPASPERAFAPAYDADVNHWWSSRERTWKMIAEREYILGGYQWIAFEHRGEAVWPRLCSISGAIDLYLQKKDAFYQNQSMWSDKPMVHMLPHWNFAGFEGESITVAVYTNCEEVELFLNGKSLGRRTAEKYTTLKWEVTYEPGEITAVAYIDGKAVCKDGHVTSGSAVRLAMRTENTAQANGRDVLLVTCSCVDEKGIEVPDAEPFVHFYSNEIGEIVGTGSANIDHVPPHIPDRQMYAGRITVAVRLKESGTLKLYARSHGLVTGILTLDVF
ncbi:MAG: DUF4982 domain-containing protein [Clostridia bacterium]|nr:DUF4982 domain-containing protein [Clostridia bacterium]